MKISTIKDRMVGASTERIRHDYNEEELVSLREELTENVLTTSDVNDAFTEVKREWKNKLKELQAEGKELATKVRQRYRDDEVECFLVPDYDNVIMEYYNSTTGELVFSRRLRPDEKQMNMLAAVHD